MANPSSKAPILTELFRDADLAPTRNHGVYLISYESAVRVLSGPPVEQQEFRELHWRAGSATGMVTRPALVGEASEDWRWCRNDSVTRSRNTAIRLSWRSPRQNDFAKRPVLNQMAQGFARLAEGIDPLDDRLDGSTDDQREDVPPRGGNRGR